MKFKFIGSWFDIMLKATCLNSLSKNFTQETQHLRMDYVSAVSWRKCEQIHTPLGPVPVSGPRTPTHCYLLHSLSNLNQTIFAKCCGLRIKTGQRTRGNKLVTSQGQFNNKGCEYKEGFSHRVSVRRRKIRRNSVHLHVLNTDTRQEQTQVKDSFTTYSQSQQDGNFTEQPFV
jgi:hypothetical protein